MELQSETNRGKGRDFSYGEGGMKGGWGNKEDQDIINTTEKWQENNVYF